MNIYEDNPDRDRVLKTISEHGSTSNMNINFRTKSGEIILGLLSTEVIELNGEKCVLALFYDITELKKMETEMARLDRLNLIGEMAAGIGHEIRNPLTTVRGFLQLLGEKQENELYKGYYDLMIQELDRANGIITEFLFLAKNKTMEFKTQSLNKIIRTILPLIEADAVRSNQCIQLDLQEVAEISLNENEIRQLILNLVFNGLEAMPPGGTRGCFGHSGPRGGN